jgi:hypothetical protein
VCRDAYGYFGNLSVPLGEMRVAPYFPTPVLWSGDGTGWSF